MKSIQSALIIASFTLLGTLVSTANSASARQGADSEIEAAQSESRTVQEAVSEPEPGRLNLHSSKLEVPIGITTPQFVTINERQCFLSVDPVVRESLIQQTNRYFAETLRSPSVVVLLACYFKGEVNTARIEYVAADPRDVSVGAYRRGFATARFRPDETDIFGLSVSQVSDVDPMAVMNIAILDLARRRSVELSGDPAEAADETASARANDPSADTEKNWVLPVERPLGFQIPDPCEGPLTSCVPDEFIPDREGTPWRPNTDPCSSPDIRSSGSVYCAPDHPALADNRNYWIVDPWDICIEAICVEAEPPFQGNPTAPRTVKTIIWKPDFCIDAICVEPVGRHVPDGDETDEEKRQRARDIAKAEEDRANKEAKERREAREREVKEKKAQAERAQREAERAREREQKRQQELQDAARDRRVAELERVESERFRRREAEKVAELAAAQEARRERERDLDKAVEEYADAEAAYEVARQVEEWNRRTTRLRENWRWAQDLCGAGFDCSGAPSGSIPPSRLRPERRPRSRGQ